MIDTLFLNSVLDFIKNTAVYAGEEILLKGFLSKDKDISYKSRTNLVTKYDRQSEEYIVNTVQKAYPDFAVVAEEGTLIESSGDYIWFIDPLDATNNFAHGIPHFCVSIGLYSRKSKTTVAGAVYEPVRKELFYASTGQGAFLNGNRIQTSNIDDLGISILATGFPYGRENADLANYAQVEQFLNNCQCVRRMGSAALDLCYVAAGRFEGFWEPMLWPWDVSAGSVIVTEAGGNVTNYRGGRFDPQSCEVLATNAHVHNAMVEILTRSTKIFPSEISARKPIL